MNEFLAESGTDFLWSVAWQTTLALAAGLSAAALCRRRPSRADSLLMAGVAAACLAPLGTLAVQELGWGVLAAQASASHIRSDRPPGLLPAARRIPPPIPAPPESLSNMPWPTASPTPRQAIPVPTIPTSAPSSAAGEPTIPAQRRSRDWPGVVVLTLSAVWLTLSAAVLARLIGAVWAARRLLNASRPACDARIEQALTLAAERLGLNTKAEARVSAQVRCPVVWCWSRRPVVLLPVEFASSPKESAWLGVFCHELAHWKRHDHVSSLAIELLCCAVPWQPLAWWAARRHHELSELACDEWVLACGQSAESYADSLLDLVPQRGAALALAVLRNRAGLARRIRHILDVVHARPHLGARWLAMLSSSTLVLIVLTALAQERPLAADDAPAAAANAEDTKTDSASLQNINEPLQQVGGVVLDLAEKPVAGARVYWVGLAAGEGASRYDPRHVYKLEPLAVGMTDERGRFAMSARFDLNAYQFPSVVVRHRSHGLGLRSELLDKERPPLKIYLPDATPIQGRILNANGMPVAGAEVLPVHLAALSRRAKSTAAKSAKPGSEDDGVWGWLTLSDDARRDGDLPDFWPRPVKTDVDGRFTIPGGDNCGEVLLRISAEGFGPHGVDVVDAAEVAEWSKGNSDPERSPPLANNFTLFLEPPRAIEGAVTDAETGRPVAGMEIVMAAQRASGNVWNHHIARATSDAQGRYRFLTPATGHDQSLTFYPPLGYAAPQMRYYPERAFAELFGDGRVYRYDIHLNRGRIVRGRVIDADTKEPVSDAEVAFQLGPGNPNIGNRDYAFSQRVLTDGGGRFQITAFSGPGVISAMTSSDQYIRTVIPPEVRSGRSYEIPNAFAAVDLPATGETPSMELAVRRGKELLVELIGPDGRPVAKVKIASREAAIPVSGRLASHLSNETPLRLRGCVPGKAYRLLIGTPDAELGAVADVTCDPANGPVKVPLQPTGTLRGTLVYADGSPADDIHTFLHFDDGAPRPKKQAESLHGLPFYNNVMPYHSKTSSVTNAEGEFEIRGIVSGIYLYLDVNYQFASDERPGGMIEPGKTLDLGKLVIKP